ncbi:MAG: HIT domain-containing protein [Methylobacter sp.]|nr:HIT domain-containing protein [Methylobacter sp.]MDP2098745.1 HIT domain-containing protein [Methylobacter sp.]MDP2426524.1 HIT domain-containing protein [Methylobacter sp.]MDP3056209.1 HIT domain-containing protein [Methylobacter sp.]MDP3361495.1 HIT domain-containing protein [Methylobacter sp.]
MIFQLNPRLEQDCIAIGRFDLCRLLLMNDSHYPWFILVPERADVREIYQLGKAERELLTEESSYLAENLAALYKADKMNIAAIGNLVPQLHIHHIVRYRNDKAWPAPVWGKFAAEPYTDREIAEHVARVKDRLNISIN